MNILFSLLLAVACNPRSNFIDQDNDGIEKENDCDDNDPLSSNIKEDADCDGIPTADDCDDTDNTLLNFVNDMDCDGVLTVDDCDDTDENSTIVANDLDCDGVETGIDCDESNADIGGDCSVCLEHFDLTSSLLAFNAVEVLPFAQGTSSRIPSSYGMMLPAPYTSLSSTDLFDYILGNFYTFPSADSSINPSMEFLDTQGLVDANETLHGSFTEMTLNVNDPNEYFMDLTTFVNTRHYRGGEYTIYSLDQAGTITILATYNIVDFHLEIDYAQASTGNYTDAMTVDVYLELINDSTGLLPVDPQISSVYLASSDLIQHVDGSIVVGQNSGPWEIYSSSTHQFMPLNSAATCPYIPSVRLRLRRQ